MTFPLRIMRRQAVRDAGGLASAQYDCALHIDSWHILQPLRPFGGVGNWS